VLWGEATAELVEFAELLGIPVMTTILAKSAFPEDHPLAIGIGGNNVTGMVDHYIKTSDVILCIGASLTRTLAATPIPPGKIVIHCTSDPGDLNTEYPTSHAVVGDVKLVLRQLIDEAKRKGGRKENAAAEIKTIRDAWLAQWMPKLTSDEVPINPYRIVWDLMNTIDRPNAIVTHDSGTPRAQLATFYRAAGPRSYIGWGNSHQLGSSLGITLGAKLAAPEKLAIAFMGDAAFGMCGMDFETAVRERIPILAIVLNNSWMAAYSAILPQATAKYEVGHISGNYTKIVEGMGWYAERVEQPNEIVPALQRGIEIVASGRPVVLEFMTRVEPAASRLGAPGP
jgi:thiamine pyrophosphate-dependent acetolactate synthase large subunit-like protein